MKRLLSSILCMVLLFCAIAVEPLSVSAGDTASAVPTGATSGTTGDCTWTLNGTALTISGKGRMADTGNFGNTKTWGKDITKVTIQSGVTHIGNNAFFDCTKLADVSIADTVTSIGENAFYDCDALVSIKIPDSITEMGKGVFTYCDKLASVTFSDSLKSISKDMFWQCRNLTSVTLGKSVESIGDDAFYLCDKLSSINIPDSVKSIGEYAFYKCTSLGNLKLSNSLTAIGHSAFEGCTFLNTVVPDSVVSIGSSAFYGTEVSRVTTNKVEYIGKVAYDITDGDMSSITIKDGTLGVGDGLASADYSLVRVTLPDTIVHIGKGAFANCDKLAEITIPSSVITIDDRAFLGCASMKSVTIPASVTTIGQYALGYTGSTYSTKTPIDGFTIYGYSGSEAQNYAKANGFTFVDLGAAPEPTVAPTQPPTVAPTEAPTAAPTQPSTEPSVKPTEPIDDGAPRFVVSDARAMAGDTVSVTLSVQNNPGITALSVKVSYPGTFTLTNVDYTSAFSSNSTGSNKLQSPFTVSWYSPSSVDEDKDGVFATLTFKVSDGAKVGSYPITLTYDEDNVFDSAFRNVGFAVQNGTFTVYDHIPGDVNGDGKVNMKDVVLLQQRINGWDVDVKDSFADTNGDGKVNMKDIVLLQQSINGWEVELK